MFGDQRPGSGFDVGGPIFDDEQSPGNQIHDSSLFDEPKQMKSLKVDEEEKVSSAQFQDSSAIDKQNSGTDRKLTIKAFLNDIQIHPSKTQLDQVDDLNDENDESGQNKNRNDDKQIETYKMKKLAVDVLMLIWRYCQEDAVAKNGQSI